MRQRNGEREEGEGGGERERESEKKQRKNGSNNNDLVFLNCQYTNSNETINNRQHATNKIKVYLNCIKTKKQ